MKAIYIIVALWPAWLHASPDPATHIYDRFLGATQGSYFVLRDQVNYGPTYYAYATHRYVLQLSVWSGDVQNHCQVSRINWSTDATRNDGIWVADRTDFKECNPFAWMARAKAQQGKPRYYETPSDQRAAQILPMGYATQRYIPSLTETVPKGRPIVLRGCTFHGPIFEAPGVDWIFHPYHCGTGDGDVDTIRVFIPISLKTWNKGR